MGMRPAVRAFVGTVIGDVQAVGCAAAVVDTGIVQVAAGIDRSTAVAWVCSCSQQVANVGAVVQQSLL